LCRGLFTIGRVVDPATNRKEVSVEFLKLLVQIPLALFTLFLLFRFMHYLAQIGTARAVGKMADLEREKIQAKKPVIYVTDRNGREDLEDE